MNKLAGFLLILSTLLVSSSAYANRYYVNTQTCNIQDANTDDNRVLLTLVYSGSPGRVTGALENAGRNDFERGQLEAFQFDTPTAGDIVSAEVELVGNNGWCFVSISISDTNRGKVSTFFYNSWLDGDDPQFPSRVSCTFTSPGSVTGNCHRP